MIYDFRFMNYELNEIKNAQRKNAQQSPLRLIFILNFKFQLCMCKEILVPKIIIFLKC